jgi:hypothetical protein
LNSAAGALHRNYSSVLIDVKLEAAPGDQSPVSVDAPELFQFGSGACAQPSSQPAATVAESDEVSGALTRCEAHVRRLERMNNVLETFGDTSWSRSDNREMLVMRLKQNKYFPAIQSLLLASRLTGKGGDLETTSTTPSTPPDSTPHANTLDSQVSESARRCGSDIAEEVSSLHRLERQTLHTVLGMLHQMSEDIPICKEEVRTMVSGAKGQYSSAKCALAGAVHRVATDQDATPSSQR